MREGQEEDRVELEEVKRSDASELLDSRFVTEKRRPE
jgi:hypothetical protein